MREVSHIHLASISLFATIALCRVVLFGAKYATLSSSQPHIDFIGPSTSKTRTRIPRNQHVRIPEQNEPSASSLTSREEFQISSSERNQQALHGQASGKTPIGRTLSVLTHSITGNREGEVNGTTNISTSRSISRSAPSTSSNASHRTSTHLQNAVVNDPVDSSQFKLPPQLPTRKYLVHLLTGVNKVHTRPRPWGYPLWCNETPEVSITARIEELMASNTSQDLLAAFGRMLESYIAWHSRVSQGLEPARCVRVLSWTCSTSVGLGDRMRGILHAALLAIETQRYLILRPPHGFPLNKILLPHRIAWDDVIALAPNSTKLHFWTRNALQARDIVEAHGARGFDARHGRHVHVEVFSRAFPHFEMLAGTRWFRAHCRSQRLRRCSYLGEENFAINKILHNALFRFSAPVVARARSIARASNLTEYISVHARIGGRLDPITGRIGRFKRDPDYIATRLLECVQVGRWRLALPKLPVYLATDNERFKDIFARHARHFGLRVERSSINPRHTKIVGRSAKSKASEENHRMVLAATFTETLMLGGAKLVVSTGSGMSNYAVITGNATLLLLRDCIKGGAS